MSIDEIFSSLSSHMIKGIMLHEQLMNSYLFLGLYGYAKCHEYHYLSETKGSILLKRFVIDHYGILIKQENFSIPDIIPASWLTIHREDVDRSTRYQAMTAALNTWISWEEETRDLYETAYKELLSKNDVPAAEFIKDYILHNMIDHSFLFL